MHEDTFVNVRESLLRAGIAPRHVNRYVTELRDHLADLVTREQSAGLDLQAAESKARAILGTDTQLVQAMLDRNAPRSLAARAPWAVFGILPLLVLVVTMILLAIASIPYFAPFSELSGDAVPGRIQVIGKLVTIVGSYGIGLLLAAACIAIAIRQRMSSLWVWTGLALIALACGPLGLHIDFLPPGNGVEGGIRGGIVQTVLTEGRVDMAETLVVMSMRAAVLFALSVAAFRVLKSRFATQIA